VDALALDITVPLRSFQLRLALDVGRETFALVGPSGAGKTTVLRAIAGLVKPRQGRISLNGHVLFDAAARVDEPPEERRVGLVFQEYALFPHMTVAQNVGYAGRAHVADLLDRFGIAHLARARPRELSGGERQRVALARALARQPDVLLLDEPLSALDAHTRAGIRAELKQILDGLGLPVLLVTHDFQDATVLADHVAVVVEGRILQLGTPAELIARPADAFVAAFTGANLLHGRVVRTMGELTEVALSDGSLVYSVDEAVGDVDVAIYPWEVSIARDQPEDSTLNHVRAPIASLVPIGNRARIQVGPIVGEVTVASVDRLGIGQGDTVVASFKAAATRLVRAAPRGDPAGS
jgi:molybdate transport system ATP-binding protein